MSPRPPLPRKVGGGSWPPPAPMGAPPLVSIKYRHLLMKCVSVFNNYSEWLEIAFNCIDRYSWTTWFWCGMAALYYRAADRFENWKYTDYASRNIYWRRTYEKGVNLNTLYLFRELFLKMYKIKHFVASSVKDLFDNIEAHKIIDFIKETRFYKQL